MALINQIEVADDRLRPHVLETPLIPAPSLGIGTQLKLENLQHTGSFKARGALNRILEQDQDAATHGIVAASTGNHALAVTWAANQASVEEVLIVAPTSITDAKRSKLAAQGVELKIHGQDCIEAELHARAISEETGRCFISPYNDLLVVAGQGTVGAELLRQTDHLDVVFIAVGGGGLISGTATMLKAHRPGIEIIGCLPSQSPAMLECVRAGRVIDVQTHPTLSDGTAGGVEPGAITLELCQELVDDWILVEEPEIAEAMALVESHHDMKIEGAAGVAVAAFLKSKDRWQDCQVAIVICGGNVSEATQGS
ncbi:MAG: threonine/serine dehydratase [Planctomycetota bacterium]|nr:threonine/serine dehydratase [Planctomycetota bacterium]